jgi:hypothetical protein
LSKRKSRGRRKGGEEEKEVRYLSVRGGKKKRKKEKKDLFNDDIVYNTTQHTLYMLYEIYCILYYTYVHPW